MVYWGRGKEEEEEVEEGQDAIYVDVEVYDWQIKKRKSKIFYLFTPSIFSFLHLSKRDLSSSLLLQQQQQNTERCRYLDALRFVKETL